MRWLVFAASLLFLYSCEKESFINSPDAQLYLSADTIRFDTVFTSVGSVTQAFKIRNDNNGKLLLSEVRLMGGNNSPFRINVNGVASDKVENIEVEKGDSIYVFITVTINPDADTLPFVVNDSIRISYNGNKRYVQLEAFGRNARFIRNGIITGTRTWTSDLPYVIIGLLKIDSSAELQVNAGSSIYLHADAAIEVFGKIRVNGESGQRVLFTGDRLDSYYRDLPGSWPGIYLRENSDGNIIRFAVIRNAYQAIVCEGGPSSLSKLVLSQTIIDNAYESGIIGVNTNLKCDNTLVSNCGRDLVILQGGNYEFTHCTLTCYNTQFLSHRYPVAYLTDEGTRNGTTVTSPLTANFTNSIFWGESGIVPDEMVTVKKGNDFSVTLNHCLLKAQSDPANTSFTSVIRNQDPLFDSTDIENNYFDFHTRNRSGAPGVNSGTTTSFLFDLDGLNRNVGNPDMGCYEKQ